MEFLIISLDDYLEDYGFEKTCELFSNYHCSRDVDVERFLKERSIYHNRHNISKTYLAFDKDELRLQGYFTIAVKCMKVERTEWQGTGEMYRRLNIHNGIMQAFLIGQLSRSDSSEKGFGTQLVNVAVRILDGIRAKIGCPVIRIDCKDELVSYYECKGFSLIGKNADATLNEMISIMM